jgi:hypothetical protein
LIVSSRTLAGIGEAANRVSAFPVALTHSAVRSCRIATDLVPAMATRRPAPRTISAMVGEEIYLPPLTWSPFLMMASSPFSKALRGSIRGRYSRFARRLFRFG